MGIRHDLQRSIYQVLQSNRDGSYATQDERQHILYKFAKDLVSLGFGLPNINGLKEKHIIAVVEHWRSNKQPKKLSNATLKNRAAVLRYLAVKLNKPNIVPTNDRLGIGKRSYVSKTSRAIHHPDFSKITDSFIRISLELQRVFGLRREESLKIRPYLADAGDYLILQPSWCKGGRGRAVPIRTEEQRYWLDKAKELVKLENHSMIPFKKSYVQHRAVYDKQVNRAGLKKMHGLRHAYGQSRYKELTGWDAPINGGLKSDQLSAEQKQIDYHARMILTEELGHGREQITTSYLGR